MRTFLLASAAAVGLAGTAAAQAPAPTAPMPVGVLGVPAAPTTYLGGNNTLNSSGGPPPVSPHTPTPGTMVVHLNGRVWGYFSVGGGSGFNVGGNKVAPAQWIGYFRLYPGVDAEATNGLRYGAIVEIRQNFIGQSYGLSITPSGTNTNAGAGSNYSSSSSGASSASTLYVRREALYVGTDQVGIFRLGQDDGPFSQFDNGITTLQLGTGLFNGDVSDAVPSLTYFAFPFWSGVGAEYTPAKLAYFSPRIAGFDFGASFAFNNGPNSASSCGIAAPGCDNISSQINGNFGGEARARNWYEFMGRYQGNFAGVGVYAIAGYSGSGHVNDPPTFPQFNGFQVGDGGLALTYAGFTVAGNVLFGNYNGEVQLQPKNGVHSISWTAGASYALGPLTIGAAYIAQDSQGSASTIVNGESLTQRHDDGIGVSASYSIAPGLTGYAEYLYSETHQGDVNLFGGKNPAAHNKVHGDGFILGTRVQW